VRALVTGAVGFIGSHLAASLLDRGHQVRGVDAFTPYYDPRQKRDNVRDLDGRDGFDLVEADLRTADLGPLLDGVDVVFHLAAQPGVRLSWSDGFATYVEHNVLATQRLLEAAKDVRIDRFVYASSSSVYGNTPTYPTTEDDLPRPHSPYGVTKLAAEHLCGLYAASFGVPAVSLRYFTVYGPRQRPDMAIYRLLRAAATGEPFPMYGDGAQVRDFTYVGDVVDANLAAATADVAPATTINVAGGGSTRLDELVALAAAVTGREIHVEPLAAQPGDVARTGGSTERAARLLGWGPSVALGEGIARQAEWQLARAEP
jgi:nucleoside-diphosphate-sugar epimerase